MAGMNFQYDETGGTFYYFLVSFYALVLIPATFWVLKYGKDNNKKDQDKDLCRCELCQTKRRKLHASKPREKLLRKIFIFLLLVAWIFFFWAAYRVSKIKTDDHVEYDPYEVLGVDRGASTAEIRKAYRELSRVNHPDKTGGDETLFMRIAKAYAALTDEESKKNWEEYGNPDGPGAMQFGIALPKWLVEGNTSVWVLMSYVVVFMIILPIVVGTWWYHSIKFSGDKVLMHTTQLYYYFINKTPNMVFKRALMILGASFEFWKRHNPAIVERPTDDEEVRKLMREVNPTLLNEKNKESPLCAPYSVKTRTLLLAHMQRIRLNPDTLQKDLDMILGKCPLLINEMVQRCAELVAYSKQGQAHKTRLDTVENIMKISPLLVQGLHEHSSQLLQLPYLTEQHLKHFVNKKRAVKNLRQFCSLPNSERLNLLKHLEEGEYKNIMAVLKMLPVVSMQCDVKVLDDEDPTITANSIVTVVVNLTRESMLEKLGNTEWESETIGATNVEEEEIVDPGEVQEEPKKVTKPWEKQKKKNKGAKKKAGKSTQKHKQQTTDKPADNEDIDAESENEENLPQANGDLEVRRGSESEGDKSDKEDGGGDYTGGDDEEDDWVEFEAESKKTKLETKSLESHSVHCPYFPTDKQEYWWLYVADKKHSDLLSVPVLVTSLRDREEIDVKFPAPRKPGTYQYYMCLKSDSYLDMDITQALKFDVKEAKVVTDHPQWDISSDEEKDSDDEGDSEESKESEFEYDDDDD